MKWTVTTTKRVQKQIAQLPESVKKRLVALLLEIEINGPIRGNWPNYSVLGKNFHHCHLKKGRPTYVAVWEMKDKKIKLVEVNYAGTHEKAPY
ncbi:MAG: cytotoxic translational repressor of toxin-antitoxin stability system [Deltaproteobacteria bacterium]|nr:cytotoxic translational repressor of toxin-antitoxin stability system [Deltaproteobacteria bacterium]